jgi:thioredoxin reductase (NADPH)
MLDVIIIGSGPAGLTAAIYTARAGLSSILFAGSALGGQMAVTDLIENYPGFPEGIGGMELAQKMQQQAERFEVGVEMDEVAEVELSDRPFTVRTQGGGEHLTKSLIVASGSSPRRLGVPGEESFAGKGVSYCATCDGFFYRGKEVAVVGGGNSALEEALFLTHFARKVSIIHRRDKFRADDLMVRRVEDHDSIELRMNSVVQEILGDDQGVTGLRVEKLTIGEVVTVPVDGVFIYVGHIPQVGFLGGQLELDERNYIKTTANQRTSLAGVFAAGDVQEPIFRQVATAVGSGARAAMEAERFLAELEGREQPARTW